MIIDNTKNYKGFKDVLLPTDNNYTTFDTCVLPYLSNMFSGESTCLFAYGHTGSGKTHTIMGYGDSNPGMYQLFARSLFKRLTKLKRNKKIGNDVTVLIKFTELYQSKLFDLLSENKRECFIREDKNGDVHVRSDPIKSKMDGKIYQYPITSIECKYEKTLIKTIKNGLELRNIGNSTLHDKSSRSHVFLEFEIVNNELIKNRNELVEIDAQILKYELLNTHPGDIKKLKMVRKTILHRIKQLLNNPKEKYIGGKMIFIDLAGNEYARDVKNGEYNSNNINNNNNNINNNNNNNKNNKKSHKLIIKEQRERTQINQSLLSLKECIRGLHEKKNYIGFRNSKLTLYLKNHLKGEKSKAIMISNIGPSEKYIKQTINTLKYTQLVAQA